MRSSKPYTLGEFREELTRLLFPLIDEFAESEADTIAEHLLDLTFSDLRLKRSMPVSRAVLEQAQAILTERLTGKPLPYILGSTFFFSKSFALSAETLIPRPDTEHLIMAILDSESSDQKIFLELGTGSGIIPEILTCERKLWRGVTTDICESTVRTAQTNFSNDRVWAILCDRFESVAQFNQYDFIVSNPPYIPHLVCTEELDSSVKDFEPMRALDGGEDGLDFYRYLASTAPSLLKPSGKIYLEIGYDQGISVPNLLSEQGATEIRVIKDFGGNDRVVTARF